MDMHMHFNSLSKNLKKNFDDDDYYWNAKVENILETIKFCSENISVLQNRTELRVSWSSHPGKKRRCDQYTTVFI